MMLSVNRICRFLIILLIIVIPNTSFAVSLIRDSEIEDTLRAYANPIFTTAGLNPEAIHLFIVDDPSLNAYVAGGANMFIHTGLILKTSTPAMLIGVMAHETGHMAGGHLAQGTEKLKDAQLGSILSMLLGVAVIAGGKGDAGIAVMGAGEDVAMRNYLHFSRANENAADQAGLNYLDSLGISAQGLLAMFEKLRQDENRSYGTPDPYIRTHPLSIDRITHVRNHVMNSTIPADSIPKGFQQRHERMIAKLSGFMNSPQQTLMTYPVSDNSVPARYARAIAYYRIPDLAKALETIDGLIKEVPRDPFFNELKGQILFENGKIEDAAASYEKASQLLPNSALILTDYAKVLLSKEHPDIPNAVKSLEHANLIDNTNVDTWHYLALAYQKQNKMGMYYLARAEQASLEDNVKEVLLNVDLAISHLEHDNPARLRANDLKIIAEKAKQDMRKGGNSNK